MWPNSRWRWHHHSWKRLLLLFVIQLQNCVLFSYAHLHLLATTFSVFIPMFYFPLYYYLHFLTYSNLESYRSWIFLITFIIVSLHVLVVSFSLLWVFKAKKVVPVSGTSSRNIIKLLVSPSVSCFLGVFLSPSCAIALPRIRPLACSFSLHPSPYFSITHSLTHSLSLSLYIKWPVTHSLIHFRYCSFYLFPPVFRYFVSLLCIDLRPKSMLLLLQLPVLLFT